MPPVVINRRTVQQRRLARRGLRLLDIAISTKTRKRYWSALQKIAYLLDAASSSTHLDVLLASYIEDQWELGAGLSLVGDTLSAVHHYVPQTRHHLPQSWRLFRIWRKVEIPSRAPPLPALVALAIAGKALEDGNLAFAIIMTLGFHCFLRTHEALNIKKHDLILGDSQGVVQLPLSKSGQRFGALESVIIYDPNVLLLLKTWLGFEHVPAALWPRSSAVFRKLFKHYVSHFHLEQYQFRPYSLRRGGATAYFHHEGLMEKALIHGRWQSSAVACQYIMEGLALLPSLRMPAQTILMLQRSAAVFSASS